MKKILVPFDFSDYAESALDFALELSQVTQGKVEVLNVIEYPLATTFNVSGEIGQFSQEDELFTLELIKKTKERLNQLSTSEKYAQADFETHVMIGNPYEGITNLVDESDIDIIIMGTKGATGLKEMFVGSNAEKVVRRAKCPVINIHKEQQFEGIKRIVYPTDLDSSHGAILDKFKEFQELFDCQIDLVWVHTPHNVIHQDVARERLEEIAKKHNLTNYEVHIAKGFYPEEGILLHAWNVKADMIAMATHGYKGLAHLFLGSVAEDLINHGTIPVWTMSLKAVKENVLS